MSTTSFGIIIWSLLATNYQSVAGDIHAQTLLQASLTSGLRGSTGWREARNKLGPKCSQDLVLSSSQTWAKSTSGFSSRNSLIDGCAFLMHSSVWRLRWRRREQRHRSSKLRLRRGRWRRRASRGTPRWTSKIPLPIRPSDWPTQSASFCLPANQQKFSVLIGLEKARHFLFSPPHARVVRNPQIEISVPLFDQIRQKKRLSSHRIFSPCAACHDGCHLRL